MTDEVAELDDMNGEPCVLCGKAILEHDDTSCSFGWTSAEDSPIYVIQAEADKRKGEQG